MITATLECWCVACGIGSTLRVRMVGMPTVYEFPHVPKEPFEPSNMDLPEGWVVVSPTADRAAYCLCKLHADQAPV